MQSAGTPGLSQQPLLAALGCERGPRQSTAFFQYFCCSSLWTLAAPTWAIWTA